MTDTPGCDKESAQCRQSVPGEKVVDAASAERSSTERGRRQGTSATVFCKVTVVRIADRSTGAADLHLADAVLNLPDGMHSHGLAKLTATSPPAAASPTAASGSTPTPSTGHRQVQELAIGAAADIEAFYDAIVPAIAKSSATSRYLSQHPLRVAPSPTRAAQLPVGPTHDVPDLRA
ncbi:hypothetical protein AB0P41_11595 [Streptomyces sp. NPDC079167]|uniref:hypothetical protein n=1 Tax=Streptomyces sp. NPDC079167 TaxID=3154513 RepID=UPI00341202EA